MIENGLYLFRCIACTATFTLRWRSERYGDKEQWKSLEREACRTCGKGSVEYVGVIHYVPEDKDAERK